MKKIITYINALYAGKTNRISYVILLMIGILLLFPISFAIIMLTLGTFGPSMLHHYPLLGWIPLGIVLLLFSIFMHILHVRRLHDIGQNSDALLYRSVPGGNLLIELLMLFRKGKKKQIPTPVSRHQTEKFLLILSIFGTVGIFFSLIRLQPLQVNSYYPSYYISFSLFINILNLVGLFSLWRWKTWGIYLLIVTSGINLLMDYVIFHNQPVVLIAMIFTWSALLIWYRGIYKRASLG